MRTTWTFHSAGQLVFGRNACAQLGELTADLGAARVMIVTDQVVARTGALDRALNSFSKASIAVEVFDGGAPEPLIPLVHDCLKAARAAAPDALVGLGGGSNIDLAKATATLYAHGDRLEDFLGDSLVPGPVLPLVCVPTTAGTGSEVSASSVLTDAQGGMKVAIMSNHLRPRLAVVDPELTLTCPPKLTADSGIDALTHAIEAFTAVENDVFPLPEGERSGYQGRHPFGDMFAEKAMALIGANLRRAVQRGDDAEAREAMALGATLGGLAFSNVGVAVVHALEYPVGVATHCSHGAGNGLLLPYVMRYNMPERIDRFGRIAQLMGENVTGLTPEQAAESAVRAVEQLKRDIGIPERLSDLGVTADQLRGFAELAHSVKRIIRVNPRPVTVEDLEDILRSAL